MTPNILILQMEHAKGIMHVMKPIVLILQMEHAMGSMYVTMPIVLNLQMVHAMGIMHVMKPIVLNLQMVHAMGKWHVLTLIVIKLDRVLAKNIDLVTVMSPMISQEISDPSWLPKIILTKTTVVCVVMDCLQHMISQQTHVSARIPVISAETIWDVLAQVDATYMYQMVTLTRA